MGLQVSLAFKEAVAAQFKALFDGGVIRVFTGAPPVNASMPETGVYLGAITRNGVPESLMPYAGLTYARNGAYIVNDPSMSFGFTPVAEGVAGWFRVVGPAHDDGTTTFTLPRVDGVVTNVGEGGHLTLLDTHVVPGVLIVPISFFFTIPPI